MGEPELEHIISGIKLYNGTTTIKKFLPKVKSVQGGHNEKARLNNVCLKKHRVYSVVLPFSPV